MLAAQPWLTPNPFFYFALPTLDPLTFSPQPNSRTPPNFLTPLFHSPPHLHTFFLSDSFLNKLVCFSTYCIPKDTPPLTLPYTPGWPARRRQAPPYPTRCSRSLTRTLNPRQDMTTTDAPREKTGNTTGVERRKEERSTMRMWTKCSESPRGRHRGLKTNEENDKRKIKRTNE